MIDTKRWINTLPKTNIKYDKEQIKLNPEKWISTIPKKNNYSPVKNYSLMAALFIFGLLFVSVVKNETRKLQKELYNLETSINNIKFNLNQSILDHEVITSPENISLLAKQYLNTDLAFYKRSQIKILNYKNDNFPKLDDEKKETTNKKSFFSLNIKKKVEKNIEEKKTEIRKLQQLYNNPESIPGEIKTQVAIKIEEKKTNLKNMYNVPSNEINFKKAGRWGAVQVVKAFLGLPIIPGR